MSAHIHQLDTRKHKAFLAQGRKDPISKSCFSEGDEVVVCANHGCRTVFRLDSWLFIESRCSVCRGSETSTDLMSCVSQPQDKTLNLAATQPRSTPRTSPVPMRLINILTFIILAAMAMWFWFSESQNNHDKLFVAPEQKKSTEKEKPSPVPENPTIKPRETRPFIAPQKSPAVLIKPPAIAALVFKPKLGEPISGHPDWEFSKNYGSQIQLEIAVESPHRQQGEIATKYFWPGGTERQGSGLTTRAAQPTSFPGKVRLPVVLLNSNKLDNPPLGIHVVQIWWKGQGSTSWQKIHEERFEIVF